MWNRCDGTYTTWMGLSGALAGKRKSFTTITTATVGPELKPEHSFAYVLYFGLLTAVNENALGIRGPIGFVCGVN